MSVHLRPEEIEAESFRIIDREVGLHYWPGEQWPVVRRAIHTSADLEYARTMMISPEALSSGIAAIKRGCGIVTDTTMIIAGMSNQRMAPYGVKTACHVADPEVAEAAKARGLTRSILAMRKGGRDARNGIFVIGNAPTALFELIRMIREEEVSPALVVGLPVGFVGAAESKQALVDLARDWPGLPFITNIGRKGGSNVAAAVMNAIFILAAA